MEPSIRLTFKRNFIAGLIVTIPIAISIFIVFQLFKIVDGLLSPVYDFIFGRHISGLGFITALIVVFVVGFISTNVFGKKLLDSIEKLLFLKIPLFKSLYSSLKQLFDAFSPENKASFQRVVVVEYPRKGSFVFGFQTKECILKDNDMGKKLVTVYIPTNNLYLGEVVLFEEDSVFHTDISVQEGIKIILSAGITAPQTITCRK
ncbi:MAG TPA: DUF502 domain-containing protein [Thermodesulfovibrio thiophilus]|uniref:DUF502 domain-containing protein n=1 Tax=Thermodesulfovibrio thiophilus TaxID=340095 RepID=UPI0018107777|nr:DUF502 domain-containing protein [Thermodesulfovibrio thiophilus]HHW20312.1 DUF502 domain-containing protein [Thermodesulfovibrio thiophilus]HOA82641.1 DUF502 domain-containing protein [Thermodesulfovibrio thiophilus]HQA03344.1 DUF502 domain-containing protein [Thermodesulfovibrio thiophilus]HQD35754.1 DUF502 domain-containing protein [Thermodesulfovibrio thiophilus]